MTKRKRCSVEKCRKLALDGSEFCLPHTPVEAEVIDVPNPEDECTVPIDKADAANWGRLDAEIRNAILGERVHELEIKEEAYQLADEHRRVIEVQKAYQEKQKQFLTSKLKHESEIKQYKLNQNVLKAAYIKLMTKIAKDNNLDLKTLEVDPDNARAKDLSFLEE